MVDIAVSMDARKTGESMSENEDSARSAVLRCEEFQEQCWFEGACPGLPTISELQAHRRGSAYRSFSWLVQLSRLAGSQLATMSGAQPPQIHSPRSQSFRIHSM